MEPVPELSQLWKTRPRSLQLPAASQEPLWVQPQEPSTTSRQEALPVSGYRELSSRGHNSQARYLVRHKEYVKCV